MLERFKWLLTKEEIDFEKVKFKGKLAGQAYKYSRHIDGLIRTRIIIFSMSLLVLYRVLANYLFHDFFSLPFLIERLVFAFVILLAGLLFNKVRVFSIILAAIPLVIISVTYMLSPAQLDFRIIALMLGIALIILSGIYHNFQSKKIKRDLEGANLGSDIIDN